jgi:hypothetical protein
MPLPLLPALAVGGSLLGGVQGYRRSGGNLGEAALGAGMGALGASGAGGLGRFAGTKLLGAAGLSRAGLGAQALGGLNTAAALGVPGAGLAQAAQALPTALGALAGGGAILSGNVGVPRTMGAQGVVNQGGGNLARGLAGTYGYGMPQGETGYLQNITQGLGPYGNIAPIGSDPFAVIDPRGRDAARRLMQRKEGETLRDNLNLLLPTVEKFSDRAKQRDLQRGLAAEGVKANIQANVEQLIRAQNAVNQLATTGMEGATNAMQTQYTY